MNAYIEENLVQPIHDFLFSTACFHCGNRLANHEHRICDLCWQTLREVKEEGHTSSVLRERFASDGIIDDWLSLYYFEKGNLLQSLAHSLKYQEITEFGFELGVRLGNTLKNRAVVPDIVVPVPLNKQKERERGYNQSVFIAEGTASVFKAAVEAHAVRRIKYTITQTHLNAQERRDNISGAFELAEAQNLQGKTILIVDDIITTGSTIQEVARVINDINPLKIYAASIGVAKLDDDV